MCSSFATTVATPAKWIGRDAPQRRSVMRPTVTVVIIGRGYISSTVG